MKSAPFLFLLLALLCRQEVKADTAQKWSGTAEITFSGTSTLHDWAGKVSAKPFTTTVSLDEAGKPTRVQATVAVAAAQMDTAEPKRDENMRKAMKAVDYPLISAVIDASAGSIASDSKTPALLPMTLTLLGKSQKITGVVSRYQRQEGKVTFDLDFPVSMKASDISVPSVLLFIRVGDVVKVHATVTLQKS
ncbi:MAG: YceI family protein [Verrucomicrobiota bacterium]